MGIWVVLQKFWRGAGVWQDEVRMMALKSVVPQGQAALHSLAVLIVLHCAAPAALQVSLCAHIAALSPTCSCLKTVIHQISCLNGSFGIPAFPHWQPPYSL